MNTFLFLLSNCSFLIPALYLWLPFNKPNYNLNISFIHGFLCLSTMIGSLLYHTCNEYQYLCLFSLSTMYVNDYIVSVIVPIHILLYNLPMSLLFIRDTIITFALFSMSYISNGYQSGDVDDIHVFQTFGIILSAIILFIRLIIRYHRTESTLWMWPIRQPGRILVWFPSEGNIWIGITCILCWISAFICFEYFSYNILYYYIHPLWHFLSALAICFSFMFLDSLN